MRTPEEKNGGLIPYRVLVVHRSARLVVVGTVSAPTAVQAKTLLTQWFPKDRYELSVSLRPDAFDLTIESNKCQKRSNLWRFVVAAKSSELSLVGFIAATKKDDARTQLLNWFPESAYELSIV